MNLIEKYLYEFKDSADSWFNQINWFLPRYDFFVNFYRKEYISQAKWEDFQKMGDNIHSFNSLAIAKKNALGKLNRPIEHYREAFEYLIRGKDPLNVRINSINNKNSTYYLKYFGESSLSELVAYAFAEDYVFYNKRDIKSLKFLGINLQFDNEDEFGDRFIKYNQALRTVLDSYKRIVGKRTETTYCLELDQFFSWLYVTHIKPTEAKSDFYQALQQFINQSQTDNLQKKGYPKTYKDLDVKVSFGAGNTAKVPWIAFLKNPNAVTYGIYPVFLYYKSDNILILAYGLSETDKPPYKWPNEEKLELVENWFIKNKNKTPDRYGTSYIKAIYDLTNELDPEKIQVDLDQLINEYISLDFGPKDQLDEPVSEYRSKRYWLIAPGERAYLWDEFHNKGIVGMGADKLGDLSKYSSKEEIKDDLKKMYPELGENQTNNAYGLWQFYKDLNEGDIIIVKRGIHEYLGYGIIKGDYYWDESRTEYKNVRKVEWKKKGVWEESVGNIVLKTLTNITKYREYVDRLTRLIGIEQEATVDANKIEYYWINANPRYWKIEDYQVGDEQTYTTHNETGNKRNRFECFQKIKPGDLVIGYETSPIRKVVAIFEVTQGAFLDEDDGKEKISFKIQKFLPEPISYEVLKVMPELSNSEVMHNNQGSLFKLSKEEFQAIISKDLSNESDNPSYSIEDADREIFIDKQGIEKILSVLEYKKNLILQGPPGVGKTFIAKRLAYLAMEEIDNSKIEMIQFHQSYSYEDFIQGYRPKDDGGFKLENGVFYRFCKKAISDPDNKYFFIIDEINRGNLSKIFGELMLLIEADKRGEKNSVSLTYTGTSENKFYIPENIYIIGTMNTADRSLAIVDYALRRRFDFINLVPIFNDKFKNELINLGVDEGIIEILINKIEALNSEIEKDHNLGKWFKIGHSFFCNVPKGTGDTEWYNNIINHEIAPLIDEYWYDNEEKVKQEIEKLLLN
jgi:5-methylcytosine-specific restriction protein B